MSDKPQPGNTMIYALTDPRYGFCVRYIGKSNHPHTRYGQHIQDAKNHSDSRKCRWIRELLAADLRPEMFIVEECEIDVWPEREMYWIHRYSDEGFELTNWHAPMSAEDYEKFVAHQKQEKEDYERRMAAHDLRKAAKLTSTFPKSWQDYKTPSGVDEFMAKLAYEWRIQKKRSEEEVADILGLDVVQVVQWSEWFQDFRTRKIAPHGWEARGDR